MTPSTHPGGLRIVALALPLALALASDAAQRGCGTFLAAQRRLFLRTSGAAGVRQPVLDLQGRTLLTAHFSLHYSPSPGVHRAKRLSEDSALNRQTDSLLATFPGSWIGYRRDSALSVSLDAMGAPHPAYVRQAALYAERAYAYYVDTLKMSAPLPAHLGGTAYLSGSQPGRIVIDLADIGKADPFYDGEYYGLTYPPPITLLLENDFLWNVGLDGNGNAVGQPVHSEINGQLQHDYSREWDIGLKVTLSHEIYHALQFGYTPGVASFHAWYELSAVGMEERLAPEVDDYFQYLPSVLSRRPSVSLFTPPPNIENYGNGIFHQFLTRSLDRAFDVKLWSTLGTNGNQLQNALLATMQAYGARWDTLFGAYAAAVAAAGRSDAAPTAFAADLPFWPVPAFDSLKGGAAVDSFGVPPLTFRLIMPTVAGAQPPKWLRSTGLSGLRFVKNQNPAGFHFQPVHGNCAPWMAGPGQGILALSVPNASFSQSGSIVSRFESQALSACPNPASWGDTSGRVFFGAPSVSPGQVLNLVSETGKTIADIALDSAGTFWSWDLRDAQKRPVPPGVYFYRLPGFSPRALVVLPR